MATERKDEKRKSAAMQVNVPRDAELHPGDDALPGTVGTGEDICPKCSGKGVLNGKTCEQCGGTGKVIEGIGGG